MIMSNELWIFVLHLVGFFLVRTEIQLSHRYSCIIKELQRTFACVTGFKLEEYVSLEIQCLVHWVNDALHSAPFLDELKYRWKLWWDACKTCFSCLHLLWQPNYLIELDENISSVFVEPHFDYRANIPKYEFVFFEPRF